MTTMVFKPVRSNFLANNSGSSGAAKGILRGKRQNQSLFVLDMLQIHRGTTFTAARSIPGGQPFLGNGMLEVEFSGLTDAGKVREHNEDFLGHAAPFSPSHARERGWLFAVADGVGGQDRGEVASRLAVETLQAGFQDYRPNESPGGCLQRLVQSANLAIYEAGAATEDANNMSTTIVACLLRYDRAAVAHVGDSRCYLIRRGQATRLTQDHSLVGEQVRMGVLSEEEAAMSDRRHILSRSLGAHLSVNVELNEYQVLPGDVLALSTDGLHGSVKPSEIAATVGQGGDLREAAGRLVALALERDGGDNATVQLVRIKSVERMGMYRGRPYKLR